MRILITGATGFLGRCIVDELVASGQEAGAVRVLVRSPHQGLAALGVEQCLGDVLREEDCARACDGVSHVYHAAGRVSRHSQDAALLREVHVEGTRHMLQAAREAAVQRMVVVSSSGVLTAPKPPAQADEDSAYDFAQLTRWPYYLSKAYQEKLALEGARRSELEVVAVLPSWLLGPGDTQGSSTAVCRQVVRGVLPLIPQGGVAAWVDVRDAARGCIAAMQHGVAGERYILSGYNMTFEVLFRRLARLAGRWRPRPFLGAQASSWASDALRLYERLGGRPVAFDALGLEMAQHNWAVSSAKAQQVLGWAPRDAEDTLREMVRDIEQRTALAA